MGAADWAALVEAWQVKQWREDARFAKLMFIVARVVGADVTLDDFLAPRPDEKTNPEAKTDNGQVALNAYLKSCARVQAN